MSTARPINRGGATYCCLSECALSGQFICCSLFGTGAAFCYKTKGSVPIRCVIGNLIMRRWSSILPFVGLLLHLCSSEEACPSIKWMDNIEVHDVSGYVDMMNDAQIATPQQCAALCCATEGCVAFVYKDAQSPPAGNVSYRRISTAALPACLPA